MNGFRKAFAAVAIAMLLGTGMTPAMAQDAINPTALSVQEEELSQALGPRDTLSGRISIPDQRAADLEKPGNKDWVWGNRVISDRVLGAAFILPLLAVIIFYVVIGRLELENGRSGRTITRFGLFERVVHWTMAASFIVLALSGLNLAVGRYLVLPWLGEDAFGTVTALGKTAHNYLAWPFMLAVVLSFFLWIRHNIPSRLDIEWFKSGGGLLKNGQHPPARKFNAGQKLVFWIVIFGGGLVALSGLALMFPYLIAAPWQWQMAQIIHALIAAGMVAMVIGHIYIATAGSEGALEAMTTGDVDVNWAEQHHSLWYEEEMAKGRAPRSAPASVTPAE